MHYGTSAFIMNDDAALLCLFRSVIAVFNQTFYHMLKGIYIIVVNNQWKSGIYLFKNCYFFFKFGMKAWPKHNFQIQ